MLLVKSCHDIDWLRHIVKRRCVRVSSFGTRAYIDTDFVKIKVFDFLTEKETVHDTGITGDSATAASGHGCVDYFHMKAFVHAVATGDLSGIHSGADATLESHRTVFAAERSRKTGTIVTFPVSYYPA